VTDRIRLPQTGLEHHRKEQVALGYSRLSRSSTQRTPGADYRLMHRDDGAADGRSIQAQILAEERLICPSKPGPARRAGNKPLPASNMHYQRTSSLQRRRFRTI